LNLGLRWGLLSGLFWGLFWGVRCFNGLIHHPAIFTHVECMFGQNWPQIDGNYKNVAGIAKWPDTEYSGLTAFVVREDVRDRFPQAG
jgi:hypothetical protein